MSWTDDLKKECSKTKALSACCKRAEIIGMIRYSGSIVPVQEDSQIYMHFSFEDNAKKALVLFREVFDKAGSISYKKNEKRPYEVKIFDDNSAITTVLALRDAKNRQITGIPPQIVNSKLCCAKGVWLGALQVAGTLGDSKTPAPLEVEVPSLEAALGLIGTARRIGTSVKIKTTKNTQKIVIKNLKEIVDFLESLRLNETASKVKEFLLSNALSNNKNSQRASFRSRKTPESVAQAAQKIKDAVEILGNNMPEHLKEVAKLRLQYPELSFGKLGKMAEPPLSKDAMASRIRRILVLAEKSKN